MTTSYRPPHKRFLHTAFLCLLPVALYCLLQGAYYWSNAGRSPDRYGVLLAMLKLRLTGQNIISVSGRNDMLLSRAEYGEKKELNLYMRNMGWAYSDQAGAVSYFRSGTKKREVFHLSMTPHFTVYTLRPPH